MERGALELAKFAREARYDPRIILYDSPYGNSPEELDSEDVSVAFLPRRSQVDLSLSTRLAKLLRRWNAEIVYAHNQVAAIYSAAAIATMGRHAPRLVLTFDSFPG